MDLQLFFCVFLKIVRQYVGYYRIFEQELINIFQSFSGVILTSLRLMKSCTRLTGKESTTWFMHRTFLLCNLVPLMR